MLLKRTSRSLRIVNECYTMLKVDDGVNSYCLAFRALNDARRLTKSGNFGQALAYYLLAIQSDGGLKISVKDEFIEAFKESCETLVHLKDFDKLFYCYAQAISVFPECDLVYNHFGSILYRLDCVDDAISCYQTALALNANLVSARENLDNIYSYLIDGWHFIMLNDYSRNSAYQRAIKKAVGAGCESVLDIGSGTGILSMFAIQSGATEVFACEENRTMYEICKCAITSNNMEGKIQVSPKNSTELIVGGDLSKKVDLIVTEILDCGVFGEKVLSTLMHAHQNLLAPSLCSRIIPMKACIFCCAIESEEIIKNHRYLHSEIHGLDLGMCRFVDFTSQPRHILPDPEAFDPYSTYDLRRMKELYRQISEPVQVLEINFSNIKEIEYLLGGYTEKFTCKVISPGHCDAIAMWFTLYLDDEISLTSSPFSWPSSTTAQSVICWHPAVYPNSINRFYAASGSYINFTLECIDEVIQLSSMELSAPCSTPAYDESRTSSVQIPEPTSESALKPLSCLAEESGDSDSKYENTTTSASPAKIFYFNTQEIARLNDVKYSTAMIDAARAIAESVKPERTSVLDITKGFSTLALQAKKVALVDSTVVNSNDYQRQVLDELAGLNAMESVTAYDDLEECRNSGTRHDVIFTSIVEADGTLQQHILEDIALARLTLLKSPYGRIVPGKLKVHGLCINSPELLEMSRVVNNSRTCGLNIAPFVNRYQVTVQRDINFDLLEYTALTETMELLSLDFNSTATDNKGLPVFLNARNCIDVTYTVQQSFLSIDALVFWFELVIDDENILSTLSASSQWKQAAFLLRDSPLYQYGESFHINSMVVDGCLNFYIS